MLIKNSKQHNFALHFCARTLVFAVLVSSSFYVFAQSLQDLSSALKASNSALVRSASLNSFNKVALIQFDPKTKVVFSQQIVNINCPRLHTNGAIIFCLGSPVTKPTFPYPRFPQFTFYDLKLNELSTGNLLAGNIISRARLSHDGKYASSTAFKVGAGYGQAGMSTEALIIDTAGKITPLSVEDFKLSHQGKIVKPIDLNVWGVTFDPKQSNFFYATASFAGTPYLVKGDVKSKTLITIAPNIECPSLSPDGKWIAFKSKKSNGDWQPALMNVASNAQTFFDEPQGLDDQIEWLDNNTIVYEQKILTPAGPKSNLMVRDITKPNDPSKVWLADATSPTFVRR